MAALGSGATAAATMNPFAVLSDIDNEDINSFPPPVAKAPAAESKPANVAKPQSNNNNTKPRVNNANNNNRQGNQNRPAANRANNVNSSANVTGDDSAVEKQRATGTRANNQQGRVQRTQKHDRQKTDVVDTNRRTESGWGSNEGGAELKAETDGAADAAADVAVPDSGAATPAPVEEEEDNTKSYEQYLKEKEQGVSSFDLAGKPTKRAAEEDPKLTEKASLYVPPVVESWLPTVAVDSIKAIAANKTVKAVTEKISEASAYMFNGGFESEQGSNRGGASGRGSSRGGRGGFNNSSNSNNNGQRPNRGSYTGEKSQRGERRSNDSRPQRGSYRGSNVGRGAGPRNAESAAVNLNDQSAFPQLG